MPIDRGCYSSKCENNSPLNMLKFKTGSNMYVTPHLHKLYTRSETRVDLVRSYEKFGTYFQNTEKSCSAHSFCTNLFYSHSMNEAHCVQHDVAMIRLMIEQLYKCCGFISNV